MTSKTIGCGYITEEIWKGQILQKKTVFSLEAFGF